MVKTIHIKVPDEVYRRYEEKFPDKEDFESLIRKIAIEIIDAPSGETWHYRQLRKLAKELDDAGVELTSKTLSKYATEHGELCGPSMARDWLARMTHDKHTELIRRGKGGEKIYRWKGNKEQDDQKRRERAVGRP